MAALLTFLAVLAFFLDSTGLTQSRLVFAGGLGVAAAVGTAGAVVGRTAVALGGAGALGALGLPSAALRIFVVPMAGVLVAAALLIALDERTVERR